MDDEHLAQDLPQVPPDDLRTNHQPQPWHRRANPAGTAGTVLSVSPRESAADHGRTDTTTDCQTGGDLATARQAKPRSEADDGAVVA